MGFLDDFTTQRPVAWPPPTGADYWYRFYANGRPFEWSGGVLLTPTSDPSITVSGSTLPADGVMVEKQFFVDTSMQSVKLMGTPPGGQVILSVIDKAQLDASDPRSVTALYGPFAGQGDAWFTYAPGATWSVDHTGVILGDPTTANALLQVDADANGNTLSKFVHLDPTGFPYWLVLRISDEADDQNIAEIWHEDPWTSTAGPIEQLIVTRGTLTDWSSPAPRNGYASLNAHAYGPVTESDLVTLNGTDVISGIHWTVSINDPTAYGGGDGSGGRWTLDDWHYDGIALPPGVAGDIAAGPHNLGIVRSGRIVAGRPHRAALTS